MDLQKDFDAGDAAAAIVNVNADAAATTITAANADTLLNGSRPNGANLVMRSEKTHSSGNQMQLYYLRCINFCHKSVISLIYC